MAQNNMAAGQAGRKSPVADPVPDLYRELQRLGHKTGNHRGADNLENRLERMRYCDLDRAILGTPATTMEGVVRQLQILGSDLNACECDPENIVINERVLGQFWLAIFGALNLLLPQVPEVPNDGSYTLADIGRCPDQGLGLFRKLAKEAGR